MTRLFFILHICFLAVAFASAPEECSQDLADNSCRDFVKGLRQTACDSGIDYYETDHLCYGYRRPDPESCIIGVGFAVDVNWVVRAQELCEHMTPPVEEAHHDHIRSMQDLKETIAHHLSHGASGEYTVEDKNLFNEIKDTVEKLNIVKNERGGTGFVLALRASKLGCKTLLTLPLTEAQS